MSLKYFIFFGVFGISTSLFSQKGRVENLPTFDKKRLHYGFYLGLNQNDFKLNIQKNTFNVTPGNIIVEPTTGFNVGIILDLRLHKNVNLRFEPGLISNTKNIIFNYLEEPKDSIREANSTFLHIPLVFKLSTDRYRNIRPYLLAGVSYDMNLSSNEKNQDDNASGEFRMKTHNFMYELGVGIDIYLPHFKFSPSIRGVFAINNELKYDNVANGPSQWTDPINFLGTRGLFLNFAFE
mgnify:CR=1 FL=1|tara:strand:+ start:655 stop:1365 length:711 start_codon:yes stop_codon:yes gene_type:complete